MLLGLLSWDTITGAPGQMLKRPAIVITAYGRHARFVLTYICS